MNMSLCKIKKTIKFSYTKKNRHQSARMLIISSDGVCNYSEKIKKRKNSAFCSSLKGSVRNGFLHGGKNLSSGSTTASRKTSCAHGVQGNIANINSKINN